MKPFDHGRRALSCAPATYADRRKLTRAPIRGLHGLLSFIALAALSMAAIPQPAAAATKPTAELTASPAVVKSGSSSKLTWSSTDPTSCKASDGWSGTLATSGSKSTGDLTAARTYEITCTGAGGSTTESTTIYLLSEVPEITFTAHPTTVKTRRLQDAQVVVQERGQLPCP